MTLLLHFQYLFKPRGGNSDLFKKIYLDNMDVVTQRLISKFDNMIIKQFNKSIFKDNPEKFVSILSNIAVSYSYLYNSQTVFDSLDDYRMNLYLICRMFIKKDAWKKRDINTVDPNRKFLTVTRHCSDKTYPKNSVVYTGQFHTLFCKNFILQYFKDGHEKLKINEEERYGRCIQLDYLPFLKKQF